MSCLCRLGMAKFVQCLKLIGIQAFGAEALSCGSDCLLFGHHPHLLHFLFLHLLTGSMFHQGFLVEFWNKSLKLTHLTYSLFM